MGQILHDLGIDRMGIDQRIALVQEIWDSVAVEAGLLPPTDAERLELDRRIAQDDAAPDDVVPWDTIKAEAQARWRR